MNTHRALVLVSGWVGQAFSLWLSSSRRPLAAEVAALKERMEKLRAENEILRARIERIEPHHRPHYAPWERLWILMHRVRYGLSVEATAHAFVVTGQTVLNWVHEVETGVVRAVQARSPLNMLPDLVREIAFFLKRQWPRFGTRRIAGILARMGIAASRTSVQRILRRPPPRRPATGRHGCASPVRAKHPGHVWVVDFTVVKQFFRSVVVGAVLDAFSRKILAIRVWKAGPDAAGACLLVRDAIRDHGRPVWLVSDRGCQSTSGRFRGFLRRRKIRRRYAAVGDANLARIDRSWRAMKDEYARGLMLFRPIRAIARQLADYVLWHDAHRPHEGLGLRTPDEIHYPQKHRKPRRLLHRRGSPPPPSFGGTGLEVRLVHGDSRLPIFRLRPVA